MIGGAMRQAGIVAAGALHALDHHVDRLADDHRRARRLAEAADAALPGVVDAAAVQTNIVVLKISDAKAVAARAADRGVLISVLGPTTARLVTHLDVDDEATSYAATVLGDVLKQPSSAGEELLSRR
jgi:threonine aldolase